MANDRGTGPATPASPANSANEIDQPSDRTAPTRPDMRQAVVAEITHNVSGCGALEAPADDGAAEAEIDAAFRRKLIGLRFLRPGEWAQVLRAAREWKCLALKALREKRASDRRARITFWLSQRPASRYPG